jgi:2-C-methyl-D-erythritol 4-phosphate cytidylyltransferase
MPASSPSPAPRFGALLVAAGHGARFGAGTPKQFLPLGGLQLFEHAARVLHAESLITAWWILVPDEHRTSVRATLDAAGLQAKLGAVVAGGETRQASVWRGLQAMRAQAPDLTHVLVHDAVRPFLTARLVRAAAAAAVQHGAATIALPVTDTLVRATASDGAPPLLDVVVDRTRAWSVQTPQAFAIDLLCRAHELANERALTATDDGGLVRAFGAPVALVHGNWWNIKVTQPEDLQRAALLLQMRERLEPGDAS